MATDHLAQGFAQFQAEAMQGRTEFEIETARQIFYSGALYVTSILAQANRAELGGIKDALRPTCLDLINEADRFIAQIEAEDPPTTNPHH